MVVSHYIPDSAHVRTLLYPRSIAIIGATDTPGKVGTMIVANLRGDGFRGDVLCVNPHRTRVFDMPCSTSLAASGRTVDCAIVVVPAHAVEAVIAESVPFCKSFIVIAAGFAESGPEGIARQERLQALADRERLAILGPNCLGVIAPPHALNASFGPQGCPSGRIALFAQSGALAVALIDQALANGDGYGLIVSLGNKMQIDESVLLEAVAEDTAIDAIALYVEDIHNGQALRRVATTLTKKKPIILLKSGRTDAGHRAMASHTGALTQADDVIDAVCARAGIVRVETFDDLVRVLKLVRQGREYALRGVAIVTNAGGLGVLTADAVMRAGLTLAEISQQTQEALRSTLPAAASVMNPIDLLGDADVDRYVAAYAALMHATDVHTIITLVTPQAQTPVEAIAHAVRHAAEQSPLQMHIAAFVGGIHTTATQKILSGSPAVWTDAPESMVAALGCMARRRTNDEAPPLADTVRAAHAKEICARAIKTSRATLCGQETDALCALYGIPCVPTVPIIDEVIPRDLSYPCVAKVDATTALHKTDRGGVIVAIPTEDALREALATLRHRFPDGMLLVQKQEESGVEILCGMVRDASFGPLIMVAYGGIYTEAIRMTEIFVPPCAKMSVAQHLRTSRLGFLFRSMRGQAAYDCAGIAAIVEGIAAMAQENPWITEIDMNPVFVYNTGRRAIAVDVKICIAPEKENTQRQ